MIHRLEVSNFYSLREPQVIDLRVAANVPDDTGRFAPIWRGAKERAPKVVAVFGPNAAGKTNVLRALGFVSWFAALSFHQAPDASWPYQRFSDDGGREALTHLAVGFAGPADLSKADDPAAPHCRYDYEFTLGGAKDLAPHVISEKLFYWPKERGRRMRLFERREDRSVTGSKAFALSGYQSEKVLRPNASLISTLAQLQHPLALKMRQVAMTIVTNVLTETWRPPEDWTGRFYAAHPEILESLNP